MGHTAKPICGPVNHAILFGRSTTVHCFIAQLVLGAAAWDGAMADAWPKGL
ncbi:hypothetical protein C1Y40_02273 [Mycobacterium talmoniae]|uniref:Uncharacterized protein n=1 Tax=Mycobacterium talmoniae TaxID=1858794 RepID=A0A2S8BLM4_9MYCO|nr:hypothetical protein C1Y40_02273 [Mycobacterium talmoniae]